MPNASLPRRSRADPNLPTRHLAYEYNGMRLHNSTSPTSALEYQPSRPVKGAFARTYGSYETGGKIAAVGAAARRLEINTTIRDRPHHQRLGDVTNGTFAGFEPLVVMDVWHAYLLDFKPPSAASTSSFFANIDWQAVPRFQRAKPVAGH